MSEVQIAVIDQQPAQVAVIDDVNLQLALAAPTQTTNIAVAFPGVQGPVGVGFPAAGGTVNQLLVKQSSADKGFQNHKKDMLFYRSKFSMKNLTRKLYKKIIY